MGRFSILWGVKEYSTSKQAAAALAAADDIRIRRRAFATVFLILGVGLVGGSLLFWPRGIFDIVSHGTTESLPLVALGGAALIGGVAVITVATRRLARLRNYLVGVGKPHSAFLNEPDFQVPTIGMGHGGPLDASVAKFGNPGKLLPGRER